MSSRLMPALVGTAAGLMLALLLFVPFIARQYRRRGQLGIGHLLLAVAAVVYGVSLLAYVLLPLPQLTADFCATDGAGGPQWVPFMFLADMAKEARGTGLGATLGNPALVQVVLNVGLFVPLGMFARHVFGRSVAASTAIGFGVSLFVETTQGTGLWFLYPCAYRLFDVDDLLVNTLGALLGALAAPVLRLVPGQRLTTEPAEPRPITWSRRLLAAVCDLMLFHFGAVLASLLGVLVVAAVRGELFGGGLPELGSGTTAAQLIGIWVPWVVLVLVLPVLGGASSLGQRIVHLKVVAPDGSRPVLWRRLVRALTGVGGYLLLAQLGVLATLFGLVSLVWLLTARGRSGLSCALSGLRVVDDREPVTAPEPVAA